jgi:hypothetical protein
LVLLAGFALARRKRFADLACHVKARWSDPSLEQTILFFGIALALSTILAFALLGSLERDPGVASEFIASHTDALGISVLVVVLGNWI